LVSVRTSPEHTKQQRDWKGRRGGLSICDSVIHANVYFWHKADMRSYKFLLCKITIHTRWTLRLRV
jgi:hypothetical protein